MWSKGVVRAAVSMPPYTGSLLGQAVWLVCDYRGTHDGPLGKKQDLSCSGGQDECITCVRMCLSYGVYGVDQALTTPRTEKKMTMAKQAYAL